MYDPLSDILTLITICIHMRTEMIKRLITLWIQLRYQFQLQFLFHSFCSLMITIKYKVDFLVDNVDKQLVNYTAYY